MSTHAEAIVERLPSLYRDGELVRGLAAVLGLQLEIVDQEARIIQRTHWFDTTVELPEAAALGASLDIPPEPWQSLGEYRAWFHALRTARLRHGAVTRAALQEFVRLYAEAFEQTNHIELLPPLEAWARESQRTGHALVDNPLRTTGVRLGGAGAVEPLTQQTVLNAGLDPSPLHLLFAGHPVGEFMPVVVNVTTGDALVYLGALRAGDRLWLRALGNGSVQAQLGRDDVSHRLYSVRQVTPGTPWTAADTGAPGAAPQALTLVPGPNELWFLPVAHFGQPGLDRVLLALADLELKQGRWDAAGFDHALFYQDPGVLLDLVWTEHVPASVLVDLDAGTMRSPAGALDDAFQAREQLVGSVDDGIRKLTAAGVGSEVAWRPLYDSQRQLDHLVFISGVTQYEVGTVGIDAAPELGGQFSLTEFDDSKYH